MIDFKDKLKGIYAITPPKFDEIKLLNDINICLGCGVKIFQIRFKEEITKELKDFFSALIKLIKEEFALECPQVTRLNPSLVASDFDIT